MENPDITLDKLILHKFMPHGVPKWNVIHGLVQLCNHLARALEVSQI